MGWFALNVGVKRPGFKVVVLEFMATTWGVWGGGFGVWTVGFGSRTVVLGWV